MKIAQVAPLYESVPPRLYGGTERVVSHLTEELVRRGHQVTLFASGDSQTNAKLVPGCDMALRLGKGAPDPPVPHLVMLERVFGRAADFDVIHFHTDYLHLPMSKRQPVPAVTTVHGRLDLPFLEALYDLNPQMPLVSISDAQRTPLPRASWIGTVYHGLPPDLHRCRDAGGNYVAFVGRFSEEKRPDLAIEIARRAGIEIRLAAKVDESDLPFFKAHVEPLLGQPGVEFRGEVDDRGRDELVGGAMALLFPIRWPEPFGLVMIESMACGTPVIAFEAGSVPEVIENGVSGFIVRDVGQAVEALARIGEIDRRACRAEFERRFSVGAMCDGYLDIYSKIVEASSSRRAMGVGGNVR